MSQTIPLPVAAGDVETAGTPTEYREAQHGDGGFRLSAATLTVELLDNPARARYQFDCRLKTTGDTAAYYWYYDVPADRGEVTDLRGFDAGGTLQTRCAPGRDGGTRVEVRMREPVRQGGESEFSFGYESVIKSVVVVGGRSRTVTYADWVIFNVPCDVLRVRVVLPSRALRVAAVPAPPQEEEGQVRYEMRNVRPLETQSYVVAYQRAQIGAPFYRWLLSAIGSGIVGALIALFFDGW
ncbi:MAG TPA: hypothetical protein VFR81_21700 [Longimicrobium sp.]|nr:hypothetical protein [Longimicrobium sp.]